MRLVMNVRTMDSPNASTTKRREQYVAHRRNRCKWSHVEILNSDDILFDGCVQCVFTRGNSASIETASLVEPTQFNTTFPEASMSLHETFA